GKARQPRRRRPTGASGAAVLDDGGAFALGLHHAALGAGGDGEVGDGRLGTAAHGAAHIDGALDLAAFVEDHRGGHQVAAHGAGLADDDLFLAHQIAVHLAVDLDDLGGDIGVDPARLADGQLVAVEGDGAIHLAFDDQVFVAADVTLDLDGHSNHGGGSHG